ncbi:MAG: 1-deoxy-D-xylulose-5-phosphate reductoisomerase [Defluviitaleaceae bacterium]|nr:1-deoxy-D-xylulose-5-phosphate reductoisomerase [Defluviitaleaceae bacterium]MCL2835598.1 1-deoxy-D-xylulose-5-phosphate reductoisomerase [Defluviitaleaceae bacterium]
MVNKSITVLGSTGSLGTQTLDVIAHTQGAKVAALAARRDIGTLEGQIKAFKPDIAAVEDEASALELKRRLGAARTEILSGREGVLAVSGYAGADLVVNCLVGAAGLEPTLAALDAGHDIALANKESLVTAGELVMAKARGKGLRILPVDGEHSAVFQCLCGNENNEVRRIILTASGGPFRGYGKERLEKVTAADALNHPVWNMGKRITIDSATLMNKGFEVIEAVWMFGIPLENVDVLVHPQGIVHSMVEFADSAVMAQLSAPDMRLPIQYAINYPKRLAGPAKKLDFAMLKELSFEAPDEDAFPCLRLAREAFRAGGTAPAVLNAVDEEAVRFFLEGRISFTNIPKLIENVLMAYTVKNVKSVDIVLEADRWAREYAARGLELLN